MDDEGRIDFSGGYGDSLIREIRDYAAVAGIIAERESFDPYMPMTGSPFRQVWPPEYSGKPLVIHVHATEFDRSGGNVNPQVYAIEREGMEQADRIITVSRLTRDTVITKYGIDPEKVMTVYNAVEPLSEAEKQQKKMGINDKIVTFLGRITFQEGPEYFLEAAALVLKSMRGVRFVMAGSGDMMEKMIEQAARLGITDRFHFTGFLQGDEVYRMFQISDVLVMPSVSEPFGSSPSRQCLLMSPSSFHASRVWLKWLITPSK